MIIENEEENTLESNSYYNLPSFIERLKKLRGVNEDSNLNFTLILLSTTIIESVLHDLLDLTIGKSFNQETINGRIAEDISLKINKATWSDFNSLSKIVLAKSINDCVDNELWKSIQILYDYRNHIMHGKSFVIEKKIKGDKTYYEYKGKMKKVFDFLMEKKVLDSKKPGVLTTKIADFFWDKTKEFVLAVSKELRNDDNEIVFLMLSDVIKNSENG